MMDRNNDIMSAEGMVLHAALDEDEDEVDRRLGDFTDRELELFFRAWRLVGLCLGEEFERRGAEPLVSERARRFVQGKG